MDDKLLSAPVPMGAGPDPARRSFLKAMPAGALVVAAGGVRAVEAAPVAVPAAPQADKGYRETEHIRTYYRTAAYW
jgi:hypothetical protein